MRERERESVCVCVCVRERERERERCDVMSCDVLTSETELQTAVSRINDRQIELK